MISVAYLSILILIVVFCFGRDNISHAYFLPVCPFCFSSDCFTCLRVFYHFFFILFSIYIALVFTFSLLPNNTEGQTLPKIEKRQSRYILAFARRTPP